MPSGVYTRTKEYRATMSNVMKGKKPKNFGSLHTNAMNQKRSITARKNKVGYWMKGKKQTKETRKKISESLKGNKRSLGCIPWNKGKEHMVGENHPNWKGGKSFEPYSKDFTEKLKEQIRKRDNYICQKCGKSQLEELKQLKQRLAIHHIDYDKKNCNSNNLITMCCSCNVLVNINRQYWQNLLSKEYAFIQ